MKKVLATLIFLSLIFSGTACTAKDDTSLDSALKALKAADKALSASESANEAIEKAQEAEDEEVYLRIASVEVSSFDITPDWAPLPNTAAIIDGNLLSRWSSKLGSEESEWLVVDFGSPKTMNKIIARWESAYAVRYGVFISDDGKAWRRLTRISEGDGGEEVIEFDPVVTQYVKFSFYEKVNPDWGYSLWELEAYGPQSANPTDKPLFEAYPERAVGADQVWRELINRQKVEDKARPTIDEFHRGVAYLSWSRDELSDIVSDFTYVHLHTLGVTHVGLIVTWYQQDLDATEISPPASDEGDSPTDESLAHAIKTAHQLGMRVMLKPHVNCRSGDFRGDIVPTDEWFDNYKNFIIHYAKFAEANGIECFSVGTELRKTTPKKYEAIWRKIIREIRAVYSGTLIYSANWDEYQKVPFWDTLDFVGIDSYFPLTNKNDPTPEELEAAWEKLADEMEGWRETSGVKKPFIFTEIGYSSFDGVNRMPWASPTEVNNTSLKEDQQEQADCLNSMLNVMTKRPWFRGLYWWNYFPQERWSPLGFTLRGKLGEEVMREWYRNKI
ncbi:MAG: discoidin domain-containing protein [Candidatus Omnitrophica bacterium]|nr:discoidin domain-containing protein [Candidatus Omnitrophota bacterium]